MPDHQTLFEDSEARFSSVQAALANESAARGSAEAALAALQATLRSHQQTADAITGGAEAILLSSNKSDTEKLSLLAGAIAQAKVYGSGRESVRKLAEAAALEAQAANLRAEAMQEPPTDPSPGPGN